MKVVDHFSERHQLINDGPFAVLEPRLNVQRHARDAACGLGSDHIGLLLVTEIVYLILHGENDGVYLGLAEVSVPARFLSERCGGRKAEQHGEQGWT